MKKLMIAALLAGQIASAAPAAAAELAAGHETQPGAFAGLRLRVPLDRNVPDRGVRAGFTVAPALQTRDIQGASRTRIGEGIELGLAGDRRVQLSLGGTPVSQLRPGGQAPRGQRAGVSTLGWVAIGAGTVVVVGLVAGYLWLDDALDCD
ncbi:MAG TPA: hypothetical protein VGX37_07165, partial [Allosphingosinicella sp.]|nr:hypothetical protein [Allosphingosinicella sp.]